MYPQEEKVQIETARGDEADDMLAAISELRAQRDAAVRLLRAALDENPTWSSDAALEAEQLVEEVDNDD